MTTQNRGPANKKVKVDYEPSGSSALQAASILTYTGTPPQWGSSQIPIDPVLQQQSHQQQMTQQQQQMQGQPPHPMMAFQYQPFPSPHYPPPGAYAPHFQQYQMARPHTPAAAPTATRPAPASASQQPHEANTTDIATLNDALGSAGVDLRAEEDALQRSHDHHQAYRMQDDRTRRLPDSPSFDARILGTRMRDIGTRHKVTQVPEDAVNYMALATRSRLQGLIEAMAKAAKHRRDAQYDRKPSFYDDGTPMWSVIVRRDLRKELEALEKAERDEEMKVRKERKEKADAAAAQAAAANAPPSSTDGGSVDDPMDGTSSVKKTKKKKDGPGVTAKNMSEDVAKRLSNATATQAAGLGKGKYAWMNAGNTIHPSPKPKAAASSSNPAGPTTTVPQVTATTAWAKPYVATSRKSTEPAVGEDVRLTVTLRDAMFVVERERGHGAGGGSAQSALKDHYYG